MTIAVDPAGGAGKIATLGAAFAAARDLRRTSDRPILITVAAGDYMLGAEDIPLTLDISDVELRGQTTLARDGDGWATGVANGTSETRILDPMPATGLTSPPALLVAPADASGTLHNVTVSNLTVDGGNGLSVEKTMGFVVHDSVVTNSVLGLHVWMASGEVRGNYLPADGCAVCVCAGSTTWPTTVLIQDNRVTAASNGAVMLLGNSCLADPGDTITATVRHNDLSGNTAKDFGFSFRVVTVRPDLGADNPAPTGGSIVATIAQNRMVGSDSAVLLDAGFPYRKTSDACDPRVYSGSIDVTFQDNEIHDNVRPAIFAFTRFQVELGTQPLASWKYLKGASFTVHDPQNELAGYVVDHPAADPLADCTDAAALDDQLTYNGAVVPPAASP